MSIVRLPPEVLQEIVLLATAPEESELRNRRSLAEHYRAIPLTLVSSSFYHASVIALYRGIRVNGSDESPYAPPRSKVLALRRSLANNASLRLHCRRLMVYRGWQHHNKGVSCPILNELTIWLTNVVEVILYGGFHLGKGNWQWLAKVSKQMPNVRKLSLRREDMCGLGFAPLIHLPGFTNLQRLQINGAWGFGRQSTKVFTCPKEKRGTGTITNLVLYDINQAPEAIRQFLLWPKRLEHFAFSDTDASYNQFSVADFRTLLFPQKDHLQTLKLESLYSRTASCIDISDFPMLEMLTLPSDDVKCSPEEAVSKLLAPKLTALVWSFTLWGQTQPDLQSFGANNANWLKVFAEMAHAKRSALRSIHIDLDPEDVMDRDVEKEDSFDRIESLVGPLAACGIGLTYTKPAWPESIPNDSLP